MAKTYIANMLVELSNITGHHLERPTTFDILMEFLANIAPPHYPLPIREDSLPTATVKIEQILKHTRETNPPKEDK